MIDTGTAIAILFWFWVMLMCGLFVSLIAWVGYVAIKMWRE